MRHVRKLTVLAACVFAAGMAAAQAPKEYETLNVEELRAVVEQGELDIVAVEPASLMVSDRKGFPARLSLAGCDADGTCRVVRIYTRYVIGDSPEGMAALQDHANNFTSATYVRVLAQDEPAVDVGRDASLEHGRTAGEILGEIATAMSAAELLRDRLMKADTFLKAMLGRR